MLANGPAETLFNRGHNAEHVEKRSVGWDLQIEINYAINWGPRVWYMTNFTSNIASV